MAPGLTFDGRDVDALRVAFSGSDDATDEVLHVGDEVTMLVKGKVTGIAHKENQFGVLRRVQSISVDHSMPADEASAKRLAREVKKREDDAANQTSLDDDIDQLTAEAESE
jgi:hypothetical protein